MTPYRSLLLRTLRIISFLLIVFARFSWIPLFSASAADKPDFETLTQSGYEHYYNLEYDQAIRDFQKALEARPNDPKAINHLLEAELFQALYNHNALDTGMYTKQRFLSGKPVPLDPTVKKGLMELAQRAMAASDKRLRTSPGDLQALYSRGVTQGLQSTYLAVAEHSFWAALRHALAARKDHEEVLKRQPNFADAKTVVGAHEYVVGSLSAPVKVMVGIVGVRGDKNKGLRMLAEAGKAGGESSMDANVALALFLRREQRYQEAIDVVRALTRERPHNFLFALEEGNLMRDAGRGPESIASYRLLLSGCKEGRYPSAHSEVAQYALGEALRGQDLLPEALEAYQAAAASSGYDPDLHQRALLGAGEVSDLLSRRSDAVAEYRAAIALDSSTEEAGVARKYLNRPYQGGRR